MFLLLQENLEAKAEVEVEVKNLRTAKKIEVEVNKVKRKVEAN